MTMLTPVARDTSARPSGSRSMPTFVVSTSVRPPASAYAWTSSVGQPDVLEDRLVVESHVEVVDEDVLVRLGEAHRLGVDRTQDGHDVHGSRTSLGGSHVRGGRAKSRMTIVGIDASARSASPRRRWLSAGDCAMLAGR